MFKPVPSSVHFPTLEAEIGKLWDEQKIYEKSLSQRADAPPFIFYEGPPTANGMPHPGHCLTRAIKDVFPRYRTMRGYRCERKAGWDTHGLPVEVEVCKELGIHSKEEIEAFGIEPFIQKCQESVWRYMQQWERLTRRIGFWVDLEKAYVTYHQSYVESVWWSLKQLFDRGLLYQGHKIVWWWAQGGTALSSGEVGQGYREVADPSVYVKFPIVADERAKKLGLDKNTSLLVWTTTPWTLPSNQFAAVHPDLEYAVVTNELDGKPERLIIAAALVETIAGKAKHELKVEWTIKGSELVGLRYIPPFDGYYSTLGKVQGDLKESGVCFVGFDAEHPMMHVGWFLIPGNFVTIDSGTGVVHLAPAFGEVDFDLFLRVQSLFSGYRFVPGLSSNIQGELSPRPELICAVAPDGKFTDDGPDYCRGRWVKDCDKEIVRDLKHRGLLFHQEQYLHDYPFCWRADEDPLIQYPRRSWFIRTSQFKDEMLANNAEINWLPEHIKDGRFGNFLATNVDWALSRERYWGTPLPIWVCEQSGQMEAVGSYDELLQKPGLQGTEVWDAAKKKNPNLVDDLRIHKPYIDAVTYDSPFAKGARMRRVTEVIDCWYDSGAMPFAQWGYPNAPESTERFDSQFPADFISEAIDQTRGWFYSQLAISTLLFGDQESGIRSQESGDGSQAKNLPLPPDPRSLTPYPHPFKNCIVLGLMLGEDGQKMSKSKRNYREPDEIFDRYGADALRWYFFANQPPWTSIRYSEQAIKDSIPEFLLRLWHTYSFFVIYANIDGFDPASAGVGGRGSGVGDLSAKILAQAKSYRPVSKRSELDRWILGELNRTAADVVAKMDAYDNFNACAAITAFVDALSNWYLRRSRERFWREDKADPDKLDAYWTLYECLLTTSKLIAPFVPFLAEALWQNLAVAKFGQQAAESVHLCDFPTGDAAAVDANLSQQMALVREVVSLGRSARMVANLKVRQPLAKVEIILADPKLQAWLSGHAVLIREELNVKEVEFASQADHYVTYTLLPDLKKLGPKLGKDLPAMKKKLAEADPQWVMQELRTKQAVTFDIGKPITLSTEEIQVRLQAREGWAAAQGPSAVVVLSTEITPELVLEGHARELVHAIQTCRKERNCGYTDRIEVGIVTDSAELRTAAEKFADYIKSETLTIELHFEPIAGVEGIEITIGSDKLTLYVKVVKT